MSFDVAYQKLPKQLRLDLLRVSAEAHDGEWLKNQGLHPSQSALGTDLSTLFARCYAHVRPLQEVQAKGSGMTDLQLLNELEKSFQD